MLVPEQVEKIMLDTGAVFVNGSLIAPCEGDNTFVVEREYRDIPYNGAPGKTKGLKRIIRENATPHRTSEGPHQPCSRWHCLL